MPRTVNVVVVGYAPHGDIVVNDCSGDTILGNYRFDAYGIETKSGIVKGFHRKFGALELLRKTLKEASKL